MKTKKSSCHLCCYLVFLFMRDSFLVSHGYFYDQCVSLAPYTGSAVDNRDIITYREGRRVFLRNSPTPKFSLIGQYGEYVFSTV